MRFTARSPFQLPSILFAGHCFQSRWQQPLWIVMSAFSPPSQPVLSSQVIHLDTKLLLLQVCWKAKSFHGFEATTSRPWHSSSNLKLLLVYWKQELIICFNIRAQSRFVLTDHSKLAWLVGTQVLSVTTFFPVATAPKTGRDGILQKM